MQYNNIKVEIEGALAVLTISRPKVMNALNDKTLTEIAGAFTELEQDDTTRVVILTGDGDKAFVAGADIVELQRADLVAAEKISAKGHDLFFQIETSDLISIAAINGFALGGGCELAMACDIRYASDSAKLGQPEINLGIIPGYGGTQRLPRFVGRGKAMELVLTGDMISAQDAKALGLVEAVFPIGELMEAAKKLASKIISKGPIAVVSAKKSITHGIDQSLAAGCALETARFSSVFSTADKQEGTTAFLEKRKPVFTGK
jgi:enoyl-CoA hydratase